MNRDEEALYVLTQFERAPWWRALTALCAALDGAAVPASEPAGLRRSYALAFRELAASGYADRAQAAALTLVVGCAAEPHLSRAEFPSGFRRPLELDLERVAAVVSRDLTGELLARGVVGLPPLEGLAPRRPPGSLADAVDEAVAVLGSSSGGEMADRFLEFRRRRGFGPAAVSSALTWSGGALAPVSQPDRPSWDGLVGVDEQLGRLERNVDALLVGGGAHNTLLYGPRGSGKSTVVRGLLERYEGRGLRLVEVAPDELGSLPELAEMVRAQPTAFVVFVDDLAFDSHETGYRPLKSLLEGGLASRPPNLVVIATSNRRHLLKEHLSDRPRPDDDDVHGWDTQNEKLALADRFALTITFPSSDQRAYLHLVRELAARLGLGQVDGEAAIRFAEWGNGYSGRTASQFVVELARRASPAAIS